MRRSRRQHYCQRGSLRSHSLQYAAIGADGGQAIGQALLQNSGLTVLECVAVCLSMCSAPCVVPHAPWRSLDGNYIRLPGAIAFGEALKTNTSLQTLEFVQGVLRSCASG